MPRDHPCFALRQELPRAYVKTSGRVCDLEVSAVIRKEQLACAARKNYGKASTGTTVVSFTRIQNCLRLLWCRQRAIVIQKINGREK